MTWLHDAQTPFSIVCGLPGIGKTALLLEFAARYAEEYDAVLVWHGGSDDDMRSSWSTLAGQLSLQGGGDAGPVDLLKQWLQKPYVNDKPARWVLLADDVISSHVLFEIGRETFSAGKTILFTRNPAVVQDLNGPDVSSVHLDILSHAQTWEVLGARGWQIDANETHDIAGDRAAACRGLPYLMHLQADILDSDGDKSLLRNAWITRSNHMDAVLAVVEPRWYPPPFSACLSVCRFSNSISSVPREEAVSANVARTLFARRYGHTAPPSFLRSLCFSNFSSTDNLLLCNKYKAALRDFNAESRTHSGMLFLLRGVDGFMVRKIHWQIIFTAMMALNVTPYVCIYMDEVAAFSDVVPLGAILAAGPHDMNAAAHIARRWIALEDVRGERGQGPSSYGPNAQDAREWAQKYRKQETKGRNKDKYLEYVQG